MALLRLLYDDHEIDCNPGRNTCLGALFPLCICNYTGKFIDSAAGCKKTPQALPKINDALLEDAQQIHPVPSVDSTTGAPVGWVSEYLWKFIGSECEQSHKSGKQSAN